MDIYYKGIEQLIEKNMIEKTRSELNINSNTLYTYFHVGKILIEAQGGEEKAKYGDRIIKEYSIRLTKKYGIGYNESNLKRMRKFYIVFQKGATMWHQLSWAHYKVLLSIKDKSKVRYYINVSIEQRLSVRELVILIKSNAYERLSYAKKESIDLEPLFNKHASPNIIDMIKDPLIININGIMLEKINERALKKYILNSIEKTMLELGIGFAFVGSEQKIKLNNTYKYIDLVFFNIKLNSYVLIELKINKLNIRDIGQIEFYVKYYDDEIRELYHNKTIGIVICRRKDNNILKYNSGNSIFVTTYKLN